MSEHKYADILRAIADGKKIQKKTDEDKWVDVSNGYVLFDIKEWEYGGEHDVDEYRVKPEKVYPVTSYTEKELGEMWMSFPGNYEDALVRVANAAIKRYIDEQGE